MKNINRKDNEYVKRLKCLEKIPGVGRSIANDLINIGIFKPGDLAGKDPEVLYRKSNEFEGCTQDICLLYVFRCAVYFAENEIHQPEKLKWWYWKDGK